MADSKRLIKLKQIVRYNLKHAAIPDPILGSPEPYQYASFIFDNDNMPIVVVAMGNDNWLENGMQAIRESGVQKFRGLIVASRKTAKDRWRLSTMENLTQIL